MNRILFRSQKTVTVYKEKSQRLSFVHMKSSGGKDNRGVCDREGSITPRDGPSLPSSASREGADMAAAGGRPSSRTTSAPTSPLKEKRSSFLGKVTSLSQVRALSCRFID
jgi:hypothetical protein